MKKTQWQFTHRPDNLTDIKRILREAREDGLTLVEVKGGPQELRGVYVDARFINEHKEHWPKFPLRSLPHPNSHYDGWTGNYIVFAGQAKEAHEHFCKNLEAAQVKPREYPPTVSVRAAGPDLDQLKRRFGNCIVCQDPSDPSGARVFRTKEWAKIEPVPLPTPAPARYVPVPGDKFTVAGKKGREGVTHHWAQTQPHEDVLECTQNYGAHLHFKHLNGKKSQLTIDAYEFKKVEEQKPYIPQVGDKFTAKGIHSGALSETIDQPHKDVFECLDTGVATLSARRPAYGGEDWTMTKGYYEFRKVPS